MSASSLSVQQHDANRAMLMILSRGGGDSSKQFDELYFAL